MQSYFGDWFDPLDESADDTAAPVITLVSPPDFPEDYSEARVTPVVLTVTDTAGIASVVITVSGAGFSGTQVVYVGGFVSPFTGSTAENITNGIQFSILPTGGWAAGNLALQVTAFDYNGNLANYTASWVIAAAAPTEFNGATAFRDSVWRWRRRLGRQKCSVISVAIDDNYTPGPGFTLTALALEIGRKQGLDRIPWRGGTFTNTSGSGNSGDGT